LLLQLMNYHQLPRPVMEQVLITKAGESAKLMAPYITLTM